ncbi:MAG TPA: rod shape-determining protein MreD [Bacteroidales bacterium]|mgnify:FL=1|jgi:rod shape-determining protein MreD|nr:rod shape-determining protein MreD [Bacteroidales bacterium]
MINNFLRYSIIFVLLILLQVLLFNNIQFSGYVNPYVYLMFILILPVEIQSWLLLLISFLTGFLIDLFSGTPGMHSSATVLAGFIRPFILRIKSPRDGYEAGSNPSMFMYGFRWFLGYSIPIVFIHHFALFYLEVFRFTDFFNTLLRVLLSSLFTITFILLLEFIRKGR